MSLCLAHQLKSNLGSRRTNEQMSRTGGSVTMVNLRNRRNSDPACGVGLNINYNKRASIACYHTRARQCLRRDRRSGFETSPALTANSLTEEVDHDP